MVYFECTRCNETLKKPKVLKHLHICGSSAVSCIDCSKVFYGNEFEAHTSCMSEAQKYQGKDYVAKGSAPKGQMKQDLWCDNVQKAIEDAAVAPQTKAHLQKLMGFNNVPRKERPFANFVKNSLKLWNDQAIADMWKVVVSAQAKKPEPTPAATKEAEHPPAAKEPEKKREAAAAPKWAGWKRALDDVLGEGGGELPWKKVRKNLVASYLKCHECAVANEDVLGAEAIASIPDEYLSKESSLVRLPAAA